MSDRSPESRLEEFSAAIERSRRLVAESRALISRVQKGSTDLSFDTFQQLLTKVGIREALTYLLRLTDYRYIGIFRFQDGKANAAVHVDRHALGILSIEEVPDTAAFCCYVRDSNGPFVTVDSMFDPRTSEHVAREAVRSYCGVPVMDPEGRLLGTLCHYDAVPRDPEQLDLELLLQVASALAQPGRLPPYPAKR